MVDRRRNLPDRVLKDIDYHDVRVDYLLTNRLRNGNPYRKRQGAAGTDMSPP